MYTKMYCTLYCNNLKLFMTALLDSDALASIGLLIWLSNATLLSELHART